MMSIILKWTVTLILSVMFTVSLVACGSGGGGGSNSSSGGHDGNIAISNLSYYLSNGQTYDDALVNVTFDFNTTNDVSSVTYNFFDSKMNEMGSFTSNIQGASGIKTGYIMGGFYLAPDFFDTMTFQIVANDMLGLHSGVLSGTFKVDGGLGTAYKYLFNSDFYGGSTAIADLNGDGLNDIIVTSAGGRNLQLFYQSAKGLLDDPVEIPTDFNISASAIGDVNNDGKLDLVLSTAQKVYIYLSYTGKLSLPKEYALNYPYTRGVKIVDLDLDGRNDVVVSTMSNTWDGRLSVLYQDSSGELNMESIIADYMYSPLQAPDIVDMDNDGDNDIVTLTTFYSVGVIKQTSKRIFSNSPEEYSSPGYPWGIHSFTTGDINGDGLNDIVYTTELYNDNYVKILIQNSQGTFDFIETLTVMYEAHDIYLYDITLDGLNDIICDLGSTFVVVPQMSDHTFGKHAYYSIDYFYGNYFTESLSLGDVTGDARLDAVVTRGENGLYVLPFYPHISTQ